MSEIRIENTSACLCCGTEISPRNRRVLRSENSENLAMRCALTFMFLKTLESLGRRCVVEEVSSAISSYCYVCRNCYTLLSKYITTESSLMEKVKGAVDQLKLFPDRTNCDDVQTAMGSKRKPPDTHQPNTTPKRLKPSSFQTPFRKGDPDVSVRLFLLCDTVNNY